MPHFLPLSLLTRDAAPRSSAPTHLSFVDRFALSIYDRLGQPVMRFTSERPDPLPSTNFFTTSGAHPNHKVFTAPLFVLSSTKAKSLPVTFNVQWPVSSLEVLNRHRLLHVAFDISKGNKWLMMTAIDEKGENSVVRACFIAGSDMKAIIKKLWHFVREVTDGASVEFRISIVKARSLSLTELRGKRCHVR